MVLCGCLSLLLFSCKEKKAQPADSATNGTIHISVDESFKPIIEEIEVESNPLQNKKK